MWRWVHHTDESTTWTPWFPGPIGADVVGGANGGYGGGGSGGGGESGWDRFTRRIKKALSTLFSQDLQPGDPPRPLTSARMAAIAKRAMITAGAPAADINNVKGAMFETAARKLTGLWPRIRPTPSSYRRRMTGGTHEAVKPDGIGSTVSYVYVWPWGFRSKTHLSQHWLEVKCRTGSLNVSTDYYQLSGMIDQLSKEAGRNRRDRGPVVFTLLTTDDAEIGPDLIRFANIRGVIIHAVTALEYPPATPGGPPELGLRDEGYLNNPSGLNLLPSTYGALGTIPLTWP